MTHGVDEYYFFRIYCEKKNINLQYCDALIDFLKNHEGIYEPQDVSFPVLDKFLTYWFIRVYLNYNQKTVDEIINLVGEFIRWNCLSYSIEDIDKLNDIKKDLVHVMLISDKVPDLKTKINLPKILFADNYWAKQFELDFKGNGEYITSWFAFQNSNANSDVLIKVKTKETFQMDGDICLLTSIGIKDEIVRLELFREKKASKWNLVNIGLVYPKRAISHILGSKLHTVE